MSSVTSIKRKQRLTRNRIITSSTIGKNCTNGLGGLHNYATVTKPVATTNSNDNLPHLKRKKQIFECNAPTNPTLSSSRKRKLVAIENDSSPTSYTNFKAITKRRSNNCDDLTPRTPCRPICLTERKRTSSSERARGLLDKFFISSTPTRSYSGKECFGPSPSRTASRGTFCSQSVPPIELIDLVNLNSAFLTVFSIHCAHNGTHCPADQKDICQEIARAWKKRNVSLIDLQRVLGVVNANIDAELESKQRLSRLVLSDYGSEKICIEISELKGNFGKVARPVNVDLLNNLFARGLYVEWRKWNGVNILEFIDSLPLEPITRCASYVRVSPLVAKGQRRLECIRDGLSTRKEKENKHTVDGIAKKTTLLERLRAKQLHQLQMPSPPSQSDIRRKMSLAKLDEVSAVLTMLSTSSSIGQKRVSFTLPTVLGKLKDSLNLGKEEGEMCIKLIATEIAPEWIQIVSLKKNEALVVDRDARPGDLEIRRRVMKAEKS
ncbi:putative dna mismatch repair protein msh-2 [Erysiphe neolycopersici]|uniref:Putative dna mismatch repair protein msh-2 n=1 Tax=Erysiphe neolycopersici TaxID=212602 RepID=A0A420H7V2_9PEZI|nr:putative dna mismatch repair protein msh-2 [Erysiphe neolycopersici]